MSGDEPGIIIAGSRIDREELKRLVTLVFGNMVKFVVDVESGRAAVGGELHADGEQMLLDQGSRQANLWGGNYFPGVEEEKCVEYTAMINIRPSIGNNGMEIMDPGIRESVRQIVLEILGRGEEL